MTTTKDDQGTPTPRTDAAELRFKLAAGPNDTGIPISGRWCHADFARELERENAALQARLTSVTSDGRHVTATDAVEELEHWKLRAEDGRKSIETLRAQLEEARADLELARQDYKDTTDRANAAEKRELELRSELSTKSNEVEELRNKTLEEVQARLKPIYLPYVNMTNAIFNKALDCASAVCIETKSTPPQPAKG